MHATFLQKVILCAMIGAAAAGMVEWYKMFVTGADDALNGKHPDKYSLSAH